MSMSIPRPSVRVLLAGGAAAAALLSLGACAPMPTGPMVAVMPPPTKPFEIFMQDDQVCRGWAAYSIGQPGHDAAADAFLRSTLAGAAIGGIAGGLAGGHRSAGSGAAVGTVIGAAAGANGSAYSGWGAQRSYDIAYQQCMYAKGNVVSPYGNPGYYYPPR